MVMPIPVSDASAHDPGVNVGMPELFGLIRAKSSSKPPPPELFGSPDAQLVKVTGSPLIHVQVPSVAWSLSPSQRLRSTPPKDAKLVNTQPFSAASLIVTRFPPNWTASASE